MKSGGAAAVAAPPTVYAPLMQFASCNHRVLSVGAALSRGSEFGIRNFK